MSFERRLYGHRGASAERPENTLVSFGRALEVGANALETDAHLTADGAVVLSHDDDGARMCGVTRSLREATLAEVQSWDAGWGFTSASGDRPFAERGHRVPTLHELLDAAPAARINIDIKPRAGAVEAVLAVLRDRRAETRVTLASFHPTVLAELYLRGYPGEIALSRGEVLLLFLPLALRLARVRGSAAQVPLSAGPLNLASRGFIDGCHAIGVRVDHWVVNDPIEAAVLLDRGADGIMTDDPAAISGVFRQAQPGSAGKSR